MELRNRPHFAAVAQEPHRRRAAERLHLARPACSEHRTQRSVSLTDAGSGAGMTTYVF
jgi:DNA-binding transcriptional LysR family regulator